MLLAEAKNLIAGIPVATTPQRWLDLGCGDGLFTLALAELLPPGSAIEAWDFDPATLLSIPDHHAGVTIRKRTTDFLRTPFPVDVDGILMSNSLHYVADQQAFMKGIRDALPPHGLLLIAEYDTDIPVPTWVPYPISQRRLATLLTRHGFSAPTSIGRRPSSYGRGDLYTAFAERSASSNPY